MAAKKLLRPRLRTLALGALILASCAHKFDTSREELSRGSLGEEVFGVLCDRMAAQALREDLTGAGSRRVCHRVGGAFSDKVDTALLPVVSGATDLEGKPVSIERQNQVRGAAISRIETLAKHRANIIRALDAAMPSIRVAVKNLDADDPALSCRASGQRNLRDELSDMLGRFIDLYNDGTLPNSTRGFARLFEAFRAREEARAAWARMSERKGYRPLDKGVSGTRAALTYSNFRDFAGGALRAVSPDSDPFAPDPKTDSNGHRIPVPGVAFSEFQKMLEVLREEFRITTVDPPVAPLRVVKVDEVGRSFLTRPRQNVEFLSELFFTEHPSFGAGTSHYRVDRDGRGLAKVATVNGTVPAPFVDKDGDGLADADEAGKFVTTATPPTPFSTGVDEPGVSRDDKGLAIASGKPVYVYGDASRMAMTSMMNDVRALGVVNPTEGREPIMNAVAGALVLLGDRDASAKKEYAGGPPLSYRAFRPESSPLLDLVYAIGQILGDATMDDVLALTKALFQDPALQNVVARVAGDALYGRDKANVHPEAKIPEKATLWDEMIDTFVEIGREPLLLEDLLVSLGDDDTALLADAYSSYMAYSDHITYDRLDLNGAVKNETLGNFNVMSTPVDRNKPQTGANRSGFHRFLMAVHDVNGVALCNKEGAEVHARLFDTELTLPLFGKYKECEVFKIDNVARFYARAIAGEARLYLRDRLLRNGVAGLGAATVELMEQSSGITGFWGGDRNSRDLFPRPEYLNRLTFFDVAGDSPNPIDYNYRTNRFIRDLIDETPTLACPAREINDPVPDAPDALPDKKVRNLRTCEAGDTMRGRNLDATFVWEQFNFFQGMGPMVRAFVKGSVPGKKRYREDLFLALLEVLNKHWPDENASMEECNLGITELGTFNVCPKTGALRYEKLVSEILGSDLLYGLRNLSKALQTVKVKHCTAADAKGTCTAAEEWSGIRVLAEATRALIDPDRAKALGLKDRVGKSTSQRNDGTTNPQVTPMYLLLQSLNAMDAAFVTYGEKNPNDSARLALWRSARSHLVDQFFDVVGKNSENGSFRNPMVAVLTPKLVDILRSQMAANCPTSFTPPYPRCAWARDELPKKFADSVRSPTMGASMDLLDAMRKDPEARVEFQKFLGYLGENPAEAGPGASIAMLDVLQMLPDEKNLVPLMHVLADALKTPAGEVGLAEAQLALLSRINGKAFDKPGKQNCARELDPNQILQALLGRLATPIKGTDGVAKETPLELLIDAISDINRTGASPTNVAPFASVDYESIAREVNDFLVNKERGLEQFYEVVRQGTVKP